MFLHLDRKHSMAVGVRHKACLSTWLVHLNDYVFCTLLPFFVDEVVVLSRKYIELCIHLRLYTYGRWNIYGRNVSIVWIKLDHFQSNAFEIAVVQITSILFSPQCLSWCYIFMTHCCIYRQMIISYTLRRVWLNSRPRYTVSKVFVIFR